MKRAAPLFLALIALVALGLYLYAASVQLTQVNTDPKRSDQSAYMSYARKLEESGYTYVGERNRMPLFPILSTLVYEEEMSEETFFLRGKWFNVALSVLLLAVLFAVYRRHLSLHGAANLVAITAFTLFAFKAPCFQGELLYYTLSFVGFWLLSRLLVRPRIGLGLLAGAVLALAQYTKSSALPSLALFLGVALLSVAWELRTKGAPAARWLRDALRSPLLVAGETVGYAVRTRAGARPVLAHAAWRTSPEAARDVLLALSAHWRTPRPLRAARTLARTARAAGSPPGVDGP